MGEDYSDKKNLQRRLKCVYVFKLCEFIYKATNIIL